MAERSFLPDFCGIRPLFVTVLGTELLAFLLTLAAGAAWPEWLERLALNSLFLQWVALGSAALLCLAGRRLPHAGDALVTALALGIVLAVTWLASELAWWLLGGWGATRAPGVERGEFVLRNLAVALIVGAFALRHLYLQHQWRARERSEAEARIQALQARIRPHFLFNSMNTIASLTRSRPEAAERAIEDLSDLFRASLAEGRSRVSLAEELALCRRYLDIEALRLGERLTVEWDVEALPMQARLPALSLQPLIENAIHHGIEPAEAGGTLRIAGERVGGSLRIVVENPLPEGGAAARAGHQLAQRNLRERLAAHFGGRAGLEAGPVGERYRVVLTLPLTESDDVSA